MPFAIRPSVSLVAASLCLAASAAVAEAPRASADDGPSFSDGARSHLPSAVVDAARDAKDLVTGRDEAATEAADATQLTVVPAVPEPETYALMAAGLGALGVVARRRLKRRDGARS